MDYYDYLFKVVVVGNIGVGKSSLFSRLVDDYFTENYNSTIGVDFKVKTFNIKDKIAKLQIWDTAGQERFRTIVNCFYRGAKGIIIVYDLGDQYSFDSINQWITSCKSEINIEIPIIVIGNKCDLKEKRVITEEQIQNLKKEYLFKYYETSAKSKINYLEPFYQFVNDLIQDSIIRVHNNNKILTNGININQTTEYLQISDGQDDHIKTQNTYNCC